MAQGAHDQASFGVSAAVWTTVTAMSESLGLVTQRKMKNVDAIVLVFWASFLNVILWMPPGVSSTIRVPFLWPTTPKDGHSFSDVTLASWLFTAGGGVAGGLGSMFTAAALKHVSVTTVASIRAPLIIGLSVVVDNMLGRRTGLFALVGIVMDVSFRITVPPNEQDPADSEEREEDPADSEERDWMSSCCLHRYQRIPGAAGSSASPGKS